MRTATRIRFLESRAAGILVDSFNRANSTASMGVAETGQSWVADVGTWGINGNQAYCVTTDTADHICHIDDGLADKTLSLSVLINNANPGIIYRFQDSNNFMMMLCLGGSGQYQIYKRVSGIYTLVQNSAGAQYTNNTTQNISITTSGDTVTLKQSGTTVLTRTDAAMPFKTATGVGFRLSGATNTPRWDNVVVL